MSVFVRRPDVRTPRRRAVRALVAGLSVLATGAIGVVAAAPASAATLSRSSGRFLTVSVAGTPSDPVLALRAASARNTGGAPVIDHETLDASVLNSLTVDLGNGISLLGGQGLLTLGAVNQYAQAANAPSSRAATGAVTDDGALSTGSPGAFPANADVNLTPLLSRVPVVAAGLNAASLNLGAIASSATADNGTSGAYQIAGGSLSLSSPAIAALIDLVNGQLDGQVTTALSGLGGNSGGLVGAINNISALQPVINATGPLAGTATVTANLAPVANILNTPIHNADNSVVINLQTGQISVDLTRFAGGLNNRAPDSEIVSAATLQAVSTEVTTLLGNLVDTLTTTLRTQLQTATVAIDVSSGQPTGLTYARVVVNGTVATVLNSTAATTVTAKAAGAPINLSGSTVLAVLAAPLNAALFNTGGAVDRFTNSLQTGLINPATNTLVPALRALDQIVSLQVNHQATANGTFSETAARLRLITTNPALAQVDLATSSVGPNPGRPAAPTITGINPVTGPTSGGQTVTVIGTGFDPDTDDTTGAVLTSVTIGGQTVTPTVTSTTSLTFTTPAHAQGPVDVAVTTAGGTATSSGGYTYVPPPVPTLATIDPVRGPTAGGTTVTLTGTGFIAGSRVTIGGTTVTPASVAGDGTSLTFTTPAHAAGPVDVTVITAGGTTPAQTFTYIPPPIAASLTPSAGPAAGGQTVTVTGSGFVAGATSVTIGGTTVPADAVTVDSSTSLRFTTPAHAAGAVRVSVTTPGGTSPTLGYTYLAAPTVVDLTPDTGPVAGGQTVRVTGTGFSADSTVTIGGTTVVPRTVTPVVLTFVTPVHDAGGVDVTVTTPGGTSDPQTYTYVTGPTLQSLTPESGPVAGGTTVRVTGTGFIPGSTVTIDGVTVTPTVASSTSLSFVTPPDTAGPVDVTVTTAGGTTPPLTYTYLAVPTATGIDPTRGPSTGGQSVTVTGTGFTPTSRVSIGGATVVPTAATATSVTFTTPAHPAGPVTVTVTTAGGTTAPQTYTYLDAPTAASLDPDSGPAAGGQQVVITGTGFVPGATTVAVAGQPVTPTAVTPIAVTFTTPAHAAGGVDVTVTTPGGTTDPLSYTYLGVPTTASLAPASGPVAGGTTVTVFGSGFAAPATVSVDGLSVPATVTSPTRLTFTTPPHAAGDADITVTTRGGTSAPALGFTYVPPPAATSLDPGAGPTAGGQTVTVTGADFVAGDTSVTIGGTPVPAAAVTVTSPTSLSFVTPQHAAGTVDVTVTTPGGTSDPLGYTYRPGPTATSLTPDEGPTAGGTAVTVAGTGFVAGDTTVTIGGTTVAAVVASSTSLLFLTPADDAGTVAVTVTTSGGTSGSLAFTYRGAPTITGLQPDSGPVAGGTSVTITGSGFVPGQTVVLVDGVPVPATATSADTVTFSTPPHAAGDVEVRVGTAGGTSGPLTFHYRATPTALTLTPTSGPTAGGQIVTVTGTGFVPGDTAVTIGGTTVTPTVDSATSLRFVTPAHVAGPVTVTVSTDGGTSGALGYTYDPALGSITLDPSSGPVLGTNTVTITGSGFTAASTVTVDGTPVVATFQNPTTLTYPAPSHAAGLVTVAVTTGAGTVTAGYTYFATPTATGIDPVSGPIVGGQSVTLTGTGFAAGATSVTIGGNTVPESTVTVDSSTTLRFVTPAHAAGPVTVTATTPGGTTVPLAYAYLVAPVAESIDPGSGPTSGGTAVTVTGSDFVPGQTTVTVAGVPVAAVATATTVSFSTPPHAAGSVPVVVSTPGGSTAPLGFTYLAAPVAASLTPPSGPATGGTSVTIAGSGFVAGSTAVTIGGVVVPTTLVTVSSPTSLSFDTPPHTPGAVQVTVTTPGGTSAPLGYSYAAPPTITALDPPTGPAAGGQTVTVTGTGFTTGTTVTVAGNPGTNVTVDSSTRLTFDTPAGDPGPAAVVVTTSNGSSAPLPYLYLAAPTLDSIDPSAGPAAGGQTVTLTGTGFEAGTTVTIGGERVVPTVVSDTELSFRTPDHAAGPVTVTAASSGGRSAPVTYTYLAAPSIVSLVPASGPTSGGQTVTVIGTGFEAGTTSVRVDTTSVPAADVSVTGPTTLSFTTPAHAAGTVGVTVSTTGGTSQPAAYTYVGAPSATSLTPESGPVAGGQTVTVTGSGFTAGTTVRVDGTTVPARVVTATSLTFATPVHAAGPVDVTVTTAGGTTAPLTYTYVPAPGAITLDPATGPTAGGQTVTVTGSGFVAGATTVRVDGAIAASTVTSATRLTFTTAPHAAGPVAVTVTTAGGTSAPAVYTYVGAPTTADLDPNRGPEAGGQTVSVTGSGFVPGATTVGIGGQTVTATVASSTSLSFVTPAHAAGGVGVTVTTPFGTSTPARGYTYLPVPTTTGLDPVRGPAPGGQTVTVTGSGFVAGATSVTTGNTVLSGGEVTVASATSLTFTTPAHAVGDVDVTVTTPGGTSAAQTYTYYAAAAVAPTIADVQPRRGPSAGNTRVRVVGTGFVPGSTSIRIGGTVVGPRSVAAAGVIVPAVASDGVTVTSPTTLYFDTPPHAPGPVSLSVITQGGESAPVTYTYYDNGPATPPAPRITSPAAGTRTSDRHPLISGIGVPGDIVTVYNGSTVLSHAVVNSAGRWSCRSVPALGLGAHALTARQTSPDGVTSAASPATAIVVVPVPATTTAPTPGGSLPVGAPITGVGQPGATITVTEGGTTLCTTTVAADGTWSCTPNPPLSPGQHTITVSQTAAGTTSRTTVTFTVPSPASGEGGGTGGLAFTGAPVLGLGSLALLLLAAGGLLLLAGHRRRRTGRG